MIARPGQIGGNRLTGFGTVLVVVVLGLAAQRPGGADPLVSGFVIVVLLAVLAVGIAWPPVAVRRVAVEVTSPRDARVGDIVALAVRSTGALARFDVRALDPVGPWRRVDSAEPCELPHRAERRGHFDAVRVEVRVTAPLGVLAAHRIVPSALPVPIDVAPVPLSVSWRPAPAPAPGGRSAAVASVGGDIVKAVRPYEPGDSARSVHWPTSARVGSLVVRESEPPAPEGQAVVVDLRGLEPADLERACSYAMGACSAVLAAGGQVYLSTAEPSGSVTEPVATEGAAGRRLARAVPGEPGTPPPRWPLVEIGR